MKGSKWFLAGLLLCGLLQGGNAWAAERVALVIGNASYQHDRVLPNPVNDANRLAATLRDLGFQVTQGNNLRRAMMERTVLEFGRKAQGADIALVYYAGHGLEVGGKNYLLPTDAELPDELALRTEAIDLDMVLDAVAPARTRLLFLDACRNNPLANDMKMRVTGRSVGRGLARVDAVSNTLIAFATAPGTIAEDGKGRNSPFAEALAQHLPSPGLEIQQVLRLVRQSVAASTDNRQVPWDSSQLFDAVVLQPGTPGTVSPLVVFPPVYNTKPDVVNEDSVVGREMVWTWVAVAMLGLALIYAARRHFGHLIRRARPIATASSAAAPEASTAELSDLETEPAAIELAFWSSIQSADDPALYQSYLEAYPQGRFVSLATIRAKQQRVQSPSAEDTCYEDELWRMAYRGRTAQALGAYLQAFPDGRYQHLAKAFLAALDTPREPVESSSILMDQKTISRKDRNATQALPEAEHILTPQESLNVEESPRSRRAEGLILMALSVISALAFSDNVWVWLLVAPSGFLAGALLYARRKLPARPVPSERSAVRIYLGWILLLPTAPLCATVIFFLITNPASFVSEISESPTSIVYMSLPCLVFGLGWYLRFGRGKWRSHDR